MITLTRHYLIGDDVHTESKQFDYFASCMILMQQFILDETTTKITLDLKE